MSNRPSWLCIDFGSKRIGLAHADEVGVPVPLEAATETSEDGRMEHIGRVLREKKVTELVVGHPVRSDGSSGPIALEVEAFARKLEDQFGLPVKLHNERHSSRTAGDHWNLKKARKQRKSGQLDSAAATVILRSFLEETLPPQELLLAPEPEDGENQPHE